MSVRWSTEASSRGRELAPSSAEEEEGWNWYEYLNAEGFEKILVGRYAAHPPPIAQEEP